MSYNLTIDPGQAIPSYGVNTSRGFTIVSQSPIAQNEIKKIQHIAGIWLELIYARETLRLPNPPSRNRLEKFQDYVLGKPLDQWQNEAEYDFFLSAIRRLARAEEMYQKMKEDYQVLSVQFEEELSHR